MNLPSKNLRQIAERLEEINRLNRTILIFQVLIFLLHGRYHASELFGNIFGGVVAIKKAGKK
jgi:hypothetical protein